ncbi:MAG: ATP-binding protein [Campylobacterota bacterium]|nr:ATP-binding protein [Campylobacterota bacterium]
MNKNKIISIIIFLIFAVLSISTYYSTLNQKEYIEIKHQQSFDTLQQMIDGKIIFFRKMFYKRISNMVTYNNNFKEAIIKNDLNQIKKMMDDEFKALKNENKYTSTLHLISKDNITIYRAHKPSLRGDNLTNIRPIVNSVNKDKRAKYGFEVGKNAVSYRIDIPLIFNNKHYGILEYGLDPALFIDDLTSVSDYIESATLINRDLYKKRFNTKSQTKEHIINLSPKYIFFDDGDFFKNIKLDDTIINTHFKHNDNHYRTFTYNLLTFDGGSIGKILIAINTNADNNIFSNIIKTSIFNQVVLILIIFLIVYYAFNYYENKIKKLLEHEKHNERVLQQQSKMASMGEMIGNIAHQWRQPLSIISTQASGIKMQKEYGVLDESTIIKSMDSIVEQTIYMSNTIDDFRDFFKSDKEKTSFSFNQAIEQNLTLVSSSYEGNNITIVKHFDNDIYISGYQSELTQSILNILNNAKDQLIKKDHENIKIVQIVTKNVNNNIILQITDNAGGVDESIKDKIFEPYFTTKHQSQGTGIGLYMTHEIISKHFNGNIEVSNVEFEYDNVKYLGAQFSITIPASQELIKL